MQKTWISLFCLFCSVFSLSGQTCSGSVGDNIFLDGNFGRGSANVLQTNPNLALGYNYVFAPPPDDGAYCITNNTSSWGSFAADSWIKIKDNSSDPLGYMMVVNASFSPGLFYEKTVTVCGNTDYEFSADVISMNDPTKGSNFIAPNVSFLINEQEVFSTGNVPVDARWHTYGFTFTTDPDAAAIKLSLRNNAPGGFGNDLALDNITFRPCGPTVVLIDTAGFCTTARDIVINSQVIGSAFGNPVFQWQQSNDGIANWLDIPGETNPILQLNNPADGQYFRLTVASSASNLAQANCRIVSNPTRVTYQPERDTVLTTICKGDTIIIDGQPVFLDQIVNVTSTASNGCDSVTTFVVTVEDLSNFQIVGNMALCKGETDTLSAGLFERYAWSDGSSFSKLIVSSPGTYAVTVTSANRCMAQDTILVQNTEISDFEITAQPPLCSYSSDGVIEVAAVQGDSPPYQYSLNGQALQQNPRYSNLSGGRYAVLVQNANGCKKIDSITLSSPPLFAVRLDSLLMVNLGDSIALKAISKAKIARYDWQPEDVLNCSDCPEPIAKPLRTSTFYLIAHNANGCEASDSITILVNNLRRVFAPNAFSPNADGINDVFQLFPGAEVARILRLEIFDRWGGLVFSAENGTSAASDLRWDGSFKGKDAPDGIYVWSARIQFIDDSFAQLQGDVMLIR